MFGFGTPSQIKIIELLLATLLLLGGPAMAFLRRRWPLWLRVLGRGGAFVCLTLLLQKQLGSPLAPDFGDMRTSVQFWERLLELGWFVTGARVCVGLLRLLIVLEHRPRETRIVSDFVAGAVYVATALAIVNFAFDVPVRGLLATSGVIAIVFGLALQSTLSDVFSGIAVGLERSYEPGDLLWVEGGIEGHVLQVNWRATQIATGGGNIAIVPNSIIAKARLVNRSAPTPQRTETVTVSTHAAAPPADTIAVLTAAVRACRIPLAQPAPAVACTGLHGDGNTFEVSFSVDRTERLGAARTELFGAIHRHLRYAGIPLAISNAAAPPQAARVTIGQLLADSDLFAALAPAERDALAARFTERRFEEAQTLMRQDEPVEALLMIAAGTLQVTRQYADGVRVVGTLGPGETVGVVGLIADRPSMATATALTPVVAYSLNHVDLCEIVRAHPPVSTALQDAAQRVQSLGQLDAVAHEDAEPMQPDYLAGRVRQWLRALASLSK